MDVKQSVFVLTNGVVPDSAIAVVTPDVVVTIVVVVLVSVVAPFFVCELVETFESIGEEF